MLSREGLAINNLWRQQLRRVMESEETPEQREARVMGHHERGEHFKVVDALLPHHSTMSEKERGAYDHAIDKLNPPKGQGPRVMERFYTPANVWRHSPSVGKEPIFKKYQELDDDDKKIHAIKTAKSWRAAHGGKDSVTVYRRKTDDDEDRDKRGWGGSSWSTHPDWLSNREGGVKATVHHSQVLLHHGHPESPLNSRNGGFDDREVILKSDANVHPVPHDPAEEKRTT